MKRLTLFFILFIATAHAATRYEQTQLFWEAQVEALANNVQNDLKLLEEAELAKTEALIYRYDALEQYRLKLKGVAPEPAHGGEKVAFLGNSSNPFLEEGFDPVVLGQLLDQIKLQKPKALFFTGNLIWSLQMPEDAPKEAKVIQLPPVYDKLGNVSYQPGGVYSAEKFKKRLERFSAVLKEHLGSEIPFYPILGESEAIGPDSVQIFLDHFPIPNSVVLETSQLVYTVTIGNAGFVAMSLPAYDKVKDAPLQQLVTAPLLQWLGKTLETESSKNSFLFAVGSVPAFSTGGAAGSYAGLDRDRDARTRFWQLLMRYKVLAYFCSNEALYDRTYRYGIWQVISGGAGAENDFDEDEELPFYHYLLLTIPERASRAPILQVFDIKGRKKDEETLTSQVPALYQFRQ